MSKKKQLNTMTLKDFHGGSIPSDLPLPTAPGVIVRSTNDHRPGYDRQTTPLGNPMNRSADQRIVRSTNDHRPGYDRQTTPWGNPMNRSADQKLRPSSSGSIRNNSLFFINTPLFNTNSNIGRNFDEDERTPLDGGPSTPRRTISDDTIRGPVVRSELKGDVGRVSNSREGSGLGSGSGGSSYSDRVVEGPNLGAVGVRLNAWGVRKEGPNMGVEVKETVSISSGGGHGTVTKFAQASALDQISSGRWQTKPVNHQVNVEVIKQSDSPSSLYSRGITYVGGGGGGSVHLTQREYTDAMSARHVERGLAIEEGFQDNFREVPGVELVRSPGALDGKESSVLFTNNGQPVYPEGYGNSESLILPEGKKISEKPKLKLLPRTKPLGVSEPSITDYKQGPQQLIYTSHSETTGKSLVNGRHVKSGLVRSEASHAKPGLSSSEVTDQVAERPKLNLKPRSQPLDQSEVNTERKRIPLFGGARPRESVLKERGVDDVLNSHVKERGVDDVLNSHEEVQIPSRTRNDIPRTEVAPAHTSTLHQAERVPNHSIDHRTGRVQQKKEQQDVQKAEMQRKNWRNENWRSTSDNTEKQPQQERPPSPETWRKPVEQSKPADTDNTLRFGKAVSAIELAQAFSRPVALPNTADHFSGQRGHTGRAQIPFSRLTGPTTRTQVNGF